MEHIDFEVRDGQAPIALTVLTGFLGAGKTTRLNRILNGSHGLRVAVLVNDFGAIDIDAELVIGVESDVVSLANGCVCCTIRDDLIETVLATDRSPRAAGVHPARGQRGGRPGRARGHLRHGRTARAHPPGQHHLRTRRRAGLRRRPRSSELKLWQIACADMLILNKVDLVERPSSSGSARGWTIHFHRYRLAQAKLLRRPQRCAVDASPRS